MTTIIPKLGSDETALEMDAAPRALLEAIPRPEFGLTPIGSDQGDIPSAIDPPSGCGV